jgi:hypothetical protein
MPISRQAIRDWVATKRQVLEHAQATGTLARTKLDMKDQARAAFGEQWANDPSGSLVMFDEELDAFCTDMRLASVTVQQQIERVPHHNLRGAVAAIAAAIITLVVFLQMANNGHDVGPGIGFTLPIMVGMIAFFVAR